VITLDRALDRLIHKRSYREAYLQGQFGVLELGASDLAVLGSMDRQALSRFAERVAADVLARKHSGSGSLLELYPRSIQSWREGHSEDASGLGLAFAFLDSRAFEGYRELPFAGIGLSLEEAFFRFCELEGLADRVIREHEFLAAMMQLLAVSPRACVELPDCIQRTAHGFYSVVHGDYPPTSKTKRRMARPCSLTKPAPSTAASARATWSEATLPWPRRAG
jgi:hypothetical protein